MMHWGDALWGGSHHKGRDVVEKTEMSTSRSVRLNLYNRHLINGA